MPHTTPLGRPLPPVPRAAARRLLTPLLLVLMALAGLRPAGAEPPLARLNDVRLDRKATSSRVVFEFSALPYYRFYDEQVARGYVYLDVYEADLAREVARDVAGDGGRITGVGRRPYPQARTLRLIIGTDRVRSVRVQLLERPARLVVDVFDSGVAAGGTPHQPWRLSDERAGAVASAPPATRPSSPSAVAPGRPAAAEPPAARIAFAASSHYSGAPVRFHATSSPRSRPLRVVVDPGHGGRDPGALSRLKFGGRAAQEKDLAMGIALELKALADADPAVEVILTRRRDEYMSLQDRVEFAEAQHADLFVSIHLNSAGPESAARGPEFFTLNEKGQGQLEARIVRSMGTNQQTRAGAGSSRAVQRMARDRVHRLTADSLALARAIDRSFDADGFFWPRNRGLKTANFYVLKNATCPTVLVEAGFMTDKDDVKRLREKARQREVAAILLRAIKAWRQQKA